MRDERQTGADGRAARARDDGAASGPAPGRAPLTAGLVGPASAAEPAPAPVQRRALATPPLEAPEPAVTGGLAEAFAAPVQLRADSEPPSTAAVHQAAADAIATPVQALPFQAELEASMGRDLSGVQAHVGGAAEELAHAAGAEALATGAHVVLPASPSKHTVAHEVAHVFQQQAGVQLQGGVGASGDRYEREADAVADAVVAGQPTGHLLGGSGAAAPTGGGGAVQKFDRHTATGPEGRGPNTSSRGAATDTPAGFKTFAEINAGTVSDFVSYMDAQADWSMEITDAGERDSLRTFAVWLRAGSHRTTGLGTFTVSEILAIRADLPALDAYCRARAETVPTVPVNEATTLADARAWGIDIAKLEGAVAGAVLHTIFTADWFEHLRSEGKVDLFCTYAQTRAPLLHARGGVEIDSFVTLAATVDPSSYADLSDVRNPHRFQQLSLDRLRANQAGNPGNLPLTLILHSAFDHNGAFHQDPELTRVILAPSNHTIMIEGAASLAAVEGRLPAIVAAHGRSEPDPADATRTVKRIDQVMIAGHGSAQSIELAGTLASNPDGTPRTDTEGDLVTAEDDLNLRVDPADPATAARAAATRAFMTTLLGHMSTDPSSPHRRVVFNACLTASNEIDPAAVDPSATPDEQARQMRGAISGSPSLVTAMRTLAGPDVDVRGGNGSFGRVGLIDGTGALDIVADGAVDAAGNARTLDPELTNPSKLVYVERGTDPGGCMSAVAECWAADRTTLIPAIGRRRAAALGADWDETLIQAMYERVETAHASNGAAIAALAHVTEGFKELVSVEQSRAWMLTSLRSGGDWQHLHDRLSVHGSWTAQRFVPLVFFHGWMFHDAAKIPSFLTAVAAMTVRTARDYIYMPWLKPDLWPQLVPAAPGGAPDPGRLRLALRDLVDGAAAIHANTRSFLTALVTAGAFTVDVAGPLDGLMSADDALRALDLHPSQRAGAGRAADPAAPPPDANVDMNDDDVNESVVEAMSATGRVTATELYVRAQPTTRGRPHPRVLHQGDEVHIMGQFRTWYLLDHDGTRGYSHKGHIDLV